MEARLWTSKDVCHYLGCSPRTLSRWRAEKIGPPALQFGTRLRFVPDQVREWALTWEELGDLYVVQTSLEAVRR